MLRSFVAVSIPTANHQPDSTTPTCMLLQKECTKPHDDTCGRYFPTPVTHHRWDAWQCQYCLLRGLWLDSIWQSAVTSTFFCTAWATSSLVGYLVLLLSLIHDPVRYLFAITLPLAPELTGASSLLCCMSGRYVPVAGRARTYQQRYQPLPTGGHRTTDWW